MANRRMLSKNIHKSKKLARLKTDFARLCWTWIIPFTDDYGRFEADPEVFRATIFPLIKTATEKRIAEALNDLCHVGLIRLYIKVESHGIQRNPNDSTEKTFNFYGEITNFDEFQTFKNDRSRKAEYPKPEQGDYISGIHWNPTTSNWNPNLTKENLNEDNLKEVVTSNNPDLKSLQKAFPIYCTISDNDLQKLCEEYPSVNVMTVLRDLHAWEKGNKDPTKNALLRLRNFFKTAAKKAGEGNGKTGRSHRNNDRPAGGEFDEFVIREEEQNQHL